MGKDLSLPGLSDNGELPKESWISFGIRAIFRWHISLGLAKLCPGVKITIADESRELNNRLGKRRVSIKELKRIIRKSKLADKCEIKEEGGVWLTIKK